jgi:hypothetical protein
MLTLKSESLDLIRGVELSIDLLSGGLEAIAERVDLQFEEADFEVKDFSLVDSDGNFLDDETASALVYKKISFSGPALSTDERVWATLSLGSHFEYSLKRWARQIPEDPTPEEAHHFLQNHLFCATSRNRYRSNSLARLWWRRRYIDKALSRNKDKAAHLFFSEGYADWVANLLERPNLAAIPSVADAIIETSYERFVGGGKKYDRLLFRGMLTKLDLIAGAVVPSLLDYEEICEEINRKYQVIVDSSFDEVVD